MLHVLMPAQEKASMHNSLTVAGLLSVLQTV